MRNKGDKMNILISINSKFVMPAIVMLTSLFENNKLPIDVYMLYSSLNKSDICKIEKCVKKYGNNLFPIYVERTLFNNAPINKHISQETYYRIIAYDILPSYLDKILYLDCDIIINKSIFNFYKQDISKYYLIACEDKIVSKKDRVVYRNLKIPKDKRYFNAGVLLYNLNLFRKNIGVDTIFTYIKENNYKIKWWDQDILNALFYDKVKFDNYEIYNLGSPYIKYNKKCIRQAYKKAAIIHFLGSVKPWNKDFDNIPLADLFWKYANKTEYRYKNLELQFRAKFYKIINLL